MRRRLTRGRSRPFATAVLTGGRASGDGAPRTASRRWRLAPWLLGLLALSAHAAHDPDRLSTLVEQGNYTEAYELAREHRAEHAGDPRFDFHYGVAAVESGHPGEGIFALERVLIAQPGSDLARLELARAYFLRGDDRRARREFEIVQSHQPPANVQAQIDRYLLAIQRRADRYETTVSGYIEAGAGHDSNVNSATASESVDTILGEVDLATAAQERSDAYGRLKGRVRVSHPVTPEINLIAEAGARGRYYQDEDAFDNGTVDGSVGALWRLPDWQVRTTLNAGRFYLDGEDYRDQTGLSAAYQLNLDERSVAMATLDVADLDYETRDTLDSTLWILGVGLSRSFATERRPTVSAQVFFGGEDADNDSIQAQADAERDIFGVQAGLRMWLAPQWSFRGTIEARASEYEEAGLLCVVAREEE